MRDAEQKRSEANQGVALTSLREDYEARNPTQEQEALALSRVRSGFMEDVQRHQRKKPSLRGHLTWPRLTFAGALGACCVLVLFMWMRPAVQFDGALKVVKQANRYTLQTPKDKPGQIQARHWRVGIAQHTRLTLSRPRPDTVVMRLKRGFVDNRVRPKTMKRFSVQVGKFDVFVKGTRFSVERRARWARVEVTRGAVWLRDHKGEVLEKLAKHEGVRIDLHSARRTRYRFPAQMPCKEPAPRAACWMTLRLRWMRKHQPWRDYVRYVRDLRDNQRFSPEARRRWLEELIDAARRKPQLQFEMAWHLYRIEKPEGKRNALYAAVRACKSIRWRKPPVARCLRTTRTFLRRYPQGHFSSSALRVWLRFARQSKAPKAALHRLLKHRPALRNTLKTALCPPTKTPSPLQSQLCPKQ